VSHELDFIRKMVFLFFTREPGEAFWYGLKEFNEDEPLVLGHRIDVSKLKHAARFVRSQFDSARRVTVP